jgi:hypothetical protein
MNGKGILSSKWVACGTIIVMALIACGARGATSPAPGSLQEIYEDANRLAQMPEGRERAMAQYHSIIEIHRANEKAYHAALRELARCYSESGQAEEGVRFFIHLAQDQWNANRRDTLKEILNRLRLKHPDAVDSILAEMGVSSGSKARTATAIPSKELAEAILQREDKPLREKALEKVKQMLAGTSTDGEKKEGLATLRSALTAKFDRKPFRDLVPPLLLSEDPQIRALALRCLPALDGTVEDVPLVIPTAQDASAPVRQLVGGALIQLAKGEAAEAVIPVLIQLLQDEDSQVVEQTIRSMWGQYTSPEFDALLIELSYNQKYHHNVIYFCLSTIRSKSPTVCGRLVEELAQPDWNNSGRAAWGLTYGVTEEAKPLVEEGLLKALPQETNEYTRKEEFRALRNVATQKSRPFLQSVVDSEMETEEARRMARDILAKLDEN